MFPGKQMDIMAKLSPRQRQIVQLMCQGCTQKEIGRQMGISYNTVRQHLKSARDRTASQTSLQLAMRANEEIKRSP
jgi:RNA polymerase sigma factor (sigma-70 family)